jgi:glycosyltransferase involved in cell wall biosynthesis
VTHQSDLVVLSHLRWTFVWQRPQHLISRLAARRRTWFVEEPLVTGVRRPRVRYEESGQVTRVWLEVPGPDRHVGFDDVAAEVYATDLPALLGEGDSRDVWLYTPLALELGRSLQPSLLVYDVMDDLASFRGAPRELKLRHVQALKAADVVFTGGRSLHRSVSQHRVEGAHLFPSGVEPEHYAPAVRRRRPKARPVAGYVGVIDERLDLDLLADLAAALPDWDIQVVGPVAKIDSAALPQAANLSYLGPRPYEALPEVMAGFDVALMPFALNEATRSISPTKTLEYLAAGLPVVSTRVPDVVADHGHVVDLQDNGAGFADACRRVLLHDAGERAVSAQPLLHWQHWDTIASRMDAILRAERSRDGAAQPKSSPVRSGAMESA